MARFIFFRIIQTSLLIFGVMVLVFFMVRLTGDPTSLMVPREASEAQREAFREAYGLNRPLHEQFLIYFTGILQGDLGDSLRLRIPNTELILQRLPATFELALASLVMAIAVAIPLGIAGGLYPGTFLDGLTRFMGLAGQTIPSFWLAMILIIIFAVNLRMFPSFGRDSLASLVLPSIALGLGVMGQLTRLTRAIVLEIRAENFVRTAHAKGIHPVQVAVRHIAPNAAIPLVTIIGLQFAYLLSGSVYIESVFSWPGLGGLLANAINDSDYPLVQAITIFLSLIAISINLFTDLIYGWLDPRIRNR